MELKRREILALTGASGVSLLGVKLTAVGASSHDWPSPRYDDANTAYIDRDGPMELTQLWMKRSGSVATPVVSGGTVYVAEGSTLRAYDTEDGSLLWSLDTDGPIEDSPTVLDGTVYVTGGPETYALNAQDGEQEWSHRSTGGTSASPKVRVDESTGGGTVYAPKDTSLYGLGRSTGTQVWSTEIGGPIGGSPALSGETVYMSGEDGNLYSLEADGGSVDWRKEVGTSIVTDPVVTDDGVFVVDSRGKAVSFNAEGDQRWTNSIRSAVTSSPAVDEDHVYVPTDDGTLHGIRTSESGFEDWVFETEQGAMTAPAVVGDSIYVGAGSILYVLNTSNGNVITQYETSSAGAPAVIGDRVYYGRSTFHAVGPGTDEAEVSISTVSVNGDSFPVGKEVTVSVTVENTGGTAGSITLGLSADGETVTSETLELSGGSEKEYSLSHTFDTPGEYSMSVNDEDLGTVTVTDEDESEQETGESNQTDGTGSEKVDDGAGQSETEGGGDTEAQGLDGFGLIGASTAVVSATLLKILGSRREDGEDN